MGDHHDDRSILKSPSSRALHDADTAADAAEQKGAAPMRQVVSQSETSSLKLDSNPELQGTVPCDKHSEAVQQLERLSRSPAGKT
jgi:hypothetical protein